MFRFLSVAIAILSLTTANLSAQLVGANTGESEDWSVDWPIANAAKVARGIGNNQGVVFWDRGDKMPDGIYTFVLDASASGTMSFSAGGQNFTLQPGEEREVYIDDFNAGNGVFIGDGYGQPFELWMPESRDQIASQDWLESISPFQVVRWMDKMQTNGSSVVSIEDWPTVDDQWDKRYPLEVIRDLSIASGISPWICIPHLADDELVAHIAQMFADLPNVRYEYSNEVWNSGFRQHQEVGDLFGQGDTRWGRAWDGYGRRSTQVMEIIRQHDPDAIRVFASQNANSYVSEQILDAAVEEGNGQLLADEWSTAPYYGGIGNGNADFWKGQPLSEWVNFVYSDIDDVMDDAAEHAALVAPYGIALTAYEAGNHVAPIGAEVGDSVFVDMTIDFSRLEDQYGLHQYYMKKWREIPNAGVLVYYMQAYRPSKYGSWGLTEELEGTSPRRRGLFAGLVDFNNDNFIDSGDIQAFVNTLLAGWPQADLNGDGIFDNGDIGTFVDWYGEATQ